MTAKIRREDDLPFRDVGNRICEARKKLGLTKSRLMELVRGYAPPRWRSIDPKTFRNFESGEVSVPADLRGPIAKALGVVEGSLFGDELVLENLCGRQALCEKVAELVERSKQSLKIFQRGGMFWAYNPRLEKVCGEAVSEKLKARTLSVQYLIGNQGFHYPEIVANAHLYAAYSYEVRFRDFSSYLPIDPWLECFIVDDTDAIVVDSYRNTIAGDDTRSASGLWLRGNAGADFVKTYWNRLWPLGKVLTFATALDFAKKDSGIYTSRTELKQRIEERVKRQREYVEKLI